MTRSYTAQIIEACEQKIAMLGEMLVIAQRYADEDRFGPGVAAVVRIEAEIAEQRETLAELRG